MENRPLVEAISPKFSNWQQRIVFDQGRHGKPSRENRDVWNPIRERQKELRLALRGGPKALGAYLRHTLDIGGKQIGAPELPRSQLTPDECQTPPVELERELWAAWSGLRRRFTSQPVYWLLCHVEWIEQGRFGQVGPRLEAALIGRRGKDLEAKTRNFLRHTGGIPHERGKTSVFSDCPLAAAWWRGHVAEQVSLIEGVGMSADEVHRVLHLHRPAWERLAMLGVQKVTVISQPNARAAIVSRLAERLRENGRLQPADVDEIAASVARLGLRRSLHDTPWQDLVA